MGNFNSILVSNGYNYNYHFLSNLLTNDAQHRESVEWSLPEGSNLEPSYLYPPKPHHERFFLGPRR